MPKHFIERDKKTNGIIPYPPLSIEALQFIYLYHTKRKNFLATLHGILNIFFSYFNATKNALISDENSLITESQRTLKAMNEMQRWIEYHKKNAASDAESKTRVEIATASLKPTKEKITALKTDLECEIQKVEVFCAELTNSSAPLKEKKLQSFKHCLNELRDLLTKTTKLSIMIEELFDISTQLKKSSIINFEINSSASPTSSPLGRANHL